MISFCDDTDDSCSCQLQCGNLSNGGSDWVIEQIVRVCKLCIQAPTRCNWIESPILGEPNEFIQWIRLILIANKNALLPARTSPTSACVTSLACCMCYSMWVIVHLYLLQLQFDHLIIQWCCADARVEEFVYEKVQGSKPQRMLENDVLGQHMIDAGNDFGPGTAYGQFSIVFLFSFL